MKSKKFILFLSKVHSAPHLDRKKQKCRNLCKCIKKEKLKYHTVISKGVCMTAGELRVEDVGRYAFIIVVVSGRLFIRLTVQTQPAIGWLIFRHDELEHVATAAFVLWN